MGSHPQPRERFKGLGTRARGCAQRTGFLLWSGRARFDAVGPGLAASTPSRRKAKAGKNAPRVMRRELGSVQASDHAHHLLGRITSTVDYDEVVPNGLGKHRQQMVFDRACSKREVPTGDHHSAYCIRHRFLRSVSAELIVRRPGIREAAGTARPPLDASRRGGRVRERGQRVLATLGAMVRPTESRDRDPVGGPERSRNYRYATTATTTRPASPSAICSTDGFPLSPGSSTATRICEPSSRTRVPRL